MVIEDYHQVNAYKSHYNSKKFALSSIPSSVEEDRQWRSFSIKFKITIGN
ncbi:hypothetical protein [Gracilibacillus sp. YIM 98692]|nr:hypothetical protein [Gracilibacillus sp. YIM 98692]